MLPAISSSPSDTHRNDIKRRVKKAQRDAVLELVNSTIDVFLSTPCSEPQVLSIRVPEVSITVAELTPTESSKMVNNPYYDKMLEAAENKKRVHAACAAARQFLVEHTVSKNPFPPAAHKTHGVSGVSPKPDKIDLSTKREDCTIQRRHAACVLHPSGLMSSSNVNATMAMTKITRQQHDNASPAGQTTPRRKKHR
ncbi:hypothetical protein V3C99_012417 [Haemonchus contortus]|uniref:Eka-like protein n=1 Tax=Haemonchus contortus TaxID=6289 RepID=A0A7I4Y3T9_HAECO